ncbi:hypothetical protein GGR54DRAFT_647043 [Hypoxylon sp. NC1633]|nr:hypothetical protein GGR54DRAFT_647043 [Hypoxylon sp. NC1633]
MAQMQSHHNSTTPVPTEGCEAAINSKPTSSQPFHVRRVRSQSQPPFIRPHTTLKTSRSLGALGVPAGRRSMTWTSSSGEIGLLSGGEEVEDRREFVNEYNRLAKRHGVRLLVPGDFPSKNVSKLVPQRKPSWLSKALRRTSSGQSTKTVIIKPEQPGLQRRRSISDVALNFVHHQKKDGLRDEKLESLVRLCGKSLFYLPTGYAPCSLVLPTCFRALAQALVQQVDTPGLFRVPGSVRVVNTLYDYYCADRDSNDISTTTRCPNLPGHIKCGIHDVASTFKRVLAGVPGGILGSLSLFDALVAIHSQFHADPELSRTKETKVRARLIALAIGTVKSQYQRELICAVFGLLCFVGRTAENAPREDENGRPLPTADLMGYNPLGMMFGPLLVNDLLASYNMKMAHPAAGLVLLPGSPPKSRKGRCCHKRSRSEKHRHRRSRTYTDDSTPAFAIDKIHVANSITEMLIIHWREVVRQMRSLGTLKIVRRENAIHHRTDKTKLASSMSDSFSQNKPSEWEEPGPSNPPGDRRLSAVATRNPIPTTPKTSLSKRRGSDNGQLEPLVVKRRRSRQSTSGNSRGTSTRPSMHGLSPTAEESRRSVGHYTANADQLSHATASSAGQAPLRRSIGGLPQETSSARRPTGNENGVNCNASELIKLTRNLEEPVGLSRDENPPIPSFKCPSNHMLSSSEKTFHSARSSIQRARNDEGYLSRSGHSTPMTKEPGLLHGRSLRIPTTPGRSPLSTKEISNIRAVDYFDIQAQDVSPADKWKSLSLASEASTESLAKAAKERRLRRSLDHVSVRQSEESLVQRDRSLTTPEWEQQLTKKRSQERQRPAKLSPQKKSMFEKYPESGYSKETESPRDFGGLSRPVPRRSSSRPMEGAVKAMAALFDKAAQDSPASSETIPVGRNRQGSQEPSAILSPYCCSKSPSKSIRSQASPAGSTRSRTFGDSAGGSQTTETPTRKREFAFSGNLDPGPLSRQITPERTPTIFPYNPLRATDNAFFASKKVPMGSPAEQVPRRDRELSHAPSLGTMVPPLEEPPVAQHMSFTRPSSAAPTTVHDGSDDGRASNGSPRARNSNSMLYARIRSLQRQVEARKEESIQLRRQLEARENMDLGKLCEQLRAAKRECKMWRERARAAEKRIAVFEQFTTRVRGLRDALTLEEDGRDLAGKEQVDGPSTHSIGPRILHDSASSSSLSGHTVTQDELRDRIRRTMKQYTPTRSIEGPQIESDGSWGRGGGMALQKKLRRNTTISSRTAELWDIAEEFLVLDGKMQRGDY